MMVLFACIQGVRAQTDASTLQDKISNQNTAIAALQAEIAQYQSQLTTLSKNKDTLANTLATLALESKKLTADIAVTQAKITEKNNQIQQLSTSIGQTSDKIVDLKTALAKMIREIQAQDTSTVVPLTMTEGTLSSFWHYMGAQNAFEKSIHTRTAELADVKIALSNNKAQVEAAKADLLGLKNQIQAQKIINQKTQDQQTQLLKATKNQEKLYQKMVADKQARKTQLETDLHSYESQLKYVLNQKLLPKSGTGVLAWPLDHIVITQFFGRTADSGRLYASGTHNGVDFGVPTGTPVMAMASGVVVDTGNSDLSCAGASYGMWVLIKYDNGLASTYGHLSQFVISRGDRVTRGEVVAYSGGTGYATGPHLHVSLYPRDGVAVSSFPSKACPGRTLTIPVAAQNAYLDPMAYLPKP